MSNRKLMINIHLILAGFFLPLMLLMPLTGSLYIWGWQGSQEKEDAFQVTNVSVPEEKAAQEAFFREQFKAHGIDFDFEYIRGNQGNFIFRPATRVHYTASLKDGTLTVSKVTPSLLKRAIELHKGHGPTIMRWYESLFGVSLILVTLSGLWLAWTVKPYRKATLISFAAGAGIIVLCML